jgi:hypothetical protein
MRLAMVKPIVTEVIALAGVRDVFALQIVSSITADLRQARPTP